MCMYDENRWLPHLTSEEEENLRRYLDVIERIHDHLEAVGKLDSVMLELQWRKRSGK